MFRSIESRSEVHANYSDNSKDIFDECQTKPIDFCDSDQFCQDQNLFLEEKSGAGATFRLKASCFPKEDDLFQCEDDIFNFLI